MSKGKDISTMFTKEENKKNGRLGYGLATREKDTIISPSQYGCVFQTAEAQKYFPKFVKSKSMIIVNPVNEQFYLQERNGKDKNIVSIGRLEPQKNNELLIRAFKKIETQFPDERLVFWGTGSKLNYLQKIVNDLEIKDKVLFAGDTNCVLEKLKNCKMFVLSSHYL